MYNHVHKRQCAPDAVLHPARFTQGCIAEHTPGLRTSTLTLSNRRVVFPRMTEPSV